MTLKSKLKELKKHNPINKFMPINDKNLNNLIFKKLKKSNHFEIKSDDMFNLNDLFEISYNYLGSISLVFNITSKKTDIQIKYKDEILDLIHNNYFLLNSNDEFIYLNNLENGTGEPYFEKHFYLIGDDSDWNSTGLIDESGKLIINQKYNDFEILSFNKIKAIYWDENKCTDISKIINLNIKNKKSTFNKLKITNQFIDDFLVEHDPEIIKLSKRNKILNRFWTKKELLIYKKTGIKKFSKWNIHFEDKDFKLIGEILNKKIEINIKNYFFEDFYFGFSRIKNNIVHFIGKDPDKTLFFNLEEE